MYAVFQPGFHPLLSGVVLTNQVFNYELNSVCVYSVVTLLFVLIGIVS